MGQLTTQSVLLLTALETIGAAGGGNNITLVVTATRSTATATGGTSTSTGGTNSATATGRRFKKGTEFLDLENFDVEVYDPSVPGGSNTVTGRLLESWGQVLLKRWTKEEKKENENRRE